MNVADQVVDLVWAGRLPGGFRAIAGLGVGQSFTQFGMMARQGLDQSLRAMVARAVGAGNIPLANHVALQAFTLTGIYSLLMVLVGVLLTDVFLRLIGASEAVKAETAMYMRVQFIGMATMGFRQASGSALQSAGDVITPLKATTVTRVCHIIVTPFLMFGWWWFPTLGLPGAALANVLAQLTGCAINFYVLFRGHSYLHLTLRGYRVDYPLLWRLIKIGAPASIAGTERATAQLVLLRLVAPFGDVAMAAYALTRRLEMFANFGSMGVGQAAGTMVGQNLGAGRPDRARQSVGWALVYVSVAKGVIGGLLMLFPAAVVVVFTGEADVVALASVWLRIQVVAAIFMGLAMVFQQSYNTAGDTLAPMVVTLLAVWCVELPLAWWLSHGAGVGVLGIGYAAIAGMAARVGCYVPYFFWGRWLRVKVI
jgi:putative MATE family efflux protein